jgi:hypothetical protein
MISIEDQQKEDGMKKGTITGRTIFHNTSVFMRREQVVLR